MMTKEISCPRPVEGEQLIYFCNLSFAISHVIVEVQDGGKLRSRDSVLISHSSSKLASLFGQDRASFLGGNESLTYTAPKQPKKEKPGERLINYIFMCGYNRSTLSWSRCTKCVVIFSRWIKQFKKIFWEYLKRKKHMRICDFAQVTQPISNPFFFRTPPSCSKPPAILFSVTSFTGMSVMTTKVKQLFL